MGVERSVDIVFRRFGYVEYGKPASSRAGINSLPSFLSTGDEFTNGSIRGNIRQEGSGTRCVMGCQ